jgi:uncharacterized protein involved in exopolysaccharide biosynthesis
MRKPLDNGRGNGFVAAPSPARWKDWPAAVDRLWEQRRDILLWAAAGVLLSAVVAFLYPKYESTVQIMPPDSSSSGLAALALPTLSKSSGSGSGLGLAGLAGEILGAKNTTAIFMKVLESRTVQDDLITRFDLRRRYHTRYWEDARKKLHSRTTISEDKKSGVITLSVQDHDSGLAVALASAYIDELDKVVARVSTSSARREREFIGQRLTEEQKVLEDAEKQFGHFASSTMTLDVPEQTKVTVESAAKLQGEMIAARAELEAYEQIYTNENFRVKSLRARVNELERELGKINSGPIVAAAAQDPTNPYPSVKSLPQLGIQWVDLYRNARVHQTVFEMLTQQYEMSKIQEAKEIPTVKVLDSPSQPERRYPPPLLVIELGAILAAALGCLNVFLRDRWSTWNVEDPRRVLLVRMYLGARGGADALVQGLTRLRPGEGKGTVEELEAPLPEEESQEEYLDRRA